MVYGVLVVPWNNSLWGSHLLECILFDSDHWHKQAMYSFVILYLSFNVLGRSFSMVCIGNCVWSFRMCVSQIFGQLVQL